MGLRRSVRALVDPGYRARLAEQERVRGERARLKAEKVARKLAKQQSITNYSSGYQLTIRNSAGEHACLDDVCNRSHVRKSATRHRRIFYHELSRLTNARILDERIRLGAEYVKAHEASLADPTFELDPVAGFQSMRLPGTPTISHGLAEARGFVESCPQDADMPTKNAMGFIVSAEDKMNYATNYIGYSSAICKLALDPYIVVPAVRYLGALPILFSATVNESRNERMEENSSQYWHVDPEDVTQVKVLIYLNDIDTEAGPFTALPGNVTQRVFDAMPGYGVGRIPDERVVEIVGPNLERVFAEPAGTAVFCDTARCLHYGSRPGTGRRYILFLMYSLPTSTWFPLLPGDGPPFTYISRFKDEAASGYERAILGMQLVPGLDESKARA